VKRVMDFFITMMDLSLNKGSNRQASCLTIRILTWILRWQVSVKKRVKSSLMKFRTLVCPGWIFLADLFVLWATTVPHSSRASSLWIGFLKRM
jgi:hypothetical protein